MDDEREIPVGQIVVELKCFTDAFDRKEKDRIEREEGGGEPANAVEAVRWFIAYYLAEDAHDCYDLKDWAHVFLDGMKPIGKTLEEIADEDWADDVAGHEGMLERLYDFHDMGEIYNQAESGKE